MYIMKKSTGSLKNELLAEAEFQSAYITHTHKRIRNETLQMLIPNASHRFIFEFRNRDELFVVSTFELISYVLQTVDIL